MAYCGCWFVLRSQNAWHGPTRHYLPQVDVKAHVQILSTASRTKLTQTFVNNTADKTPEIQYTFPLYDGVSVVSFKCIVGDKVMVGLVKERYQARADYETAVAQGQAAGLLEQNQEASDVFSTRIGNVPKDGKAVVEIEYVGELKHDAQLDGVRYTLPTSIAPRYGTTNSNSYASLQSIRDGKLEIIVDVEVDEGANIESLSSPSHPIAMTMGRTSTKKDVFKPNRASGTLSLGKAELTNDFIVVINAQDHGLPRALLEEHPKISQHRALMTTLVPKFNLPNIHPEIVFVVDRSGSMGGKIPTVVQALNVFLKSLPLSAKFNICSFGSNHSFLFQKSLPYDEKSLQSALSAVQYFGADYGGTEMLRPIEATVKNRLHGIPLEIMVLTDGEIWNQQELFDFLNEAAKENVRLFSLGIGASASTSLVEGLARAGNGFAQFVRDNEQMDRRVVRMLKAALSPHIDDYSLEVNYENESEDDFEIVEPIKLAHRKRKSDSGEAEKENASPAPISLFDSNFTETAPNPPAGRYDHLPKLQPPSALQTPNSISGLFPYNRVCAYILLPESNRKIKSVMLKGTCNKTPVQLEIPVQNVGLGKTIHQLAAKKAMLETEEGRGWLSSASANDGVSIKSKYASDWERIVEREAVRLGVKFQVAGKYCSFVATEYGLDEIKKEQSRSSSSPSNANGEKFGLDFSTLDGSKILESLDFDNFLSDTESCYSESYEPDTDTKNSHNPGIATKKSRTGDSSERKGVAYIKPELRTVAPASSPPIPMSMLGSYSSARSAFGSFPPMISASYFGSSQTTASAPLFGNAAHSGTGFGHSQNAPAFGSSQQPASGFAFGNTSHSANIVGYQQNMSMQQNMQSMHSTPSTFGNISTSGLPIQDQTAIPEQQNKQRYLQHVQAPRRQRALQQMQQASALSQQPAPEPRFVMSSFSTPINPFHKQSSGTGLFGQSPPNLSSPQQQHTGFGGGFGSSNTQGVFGATLARQGESITTFDVDDTQSNYLANAFLGQQNASTGTTTHSSKVPETTKGKMHAIIGLQNFDGSWEARTELFTLIDVSKEDFDDTSMLQQVEDGKAKATILAIAWLEMMAYKEMEVWDMVVDKAKVWLGTNHGVNDVDDLVRRAIAIFFA